MERTYPIAPQTITIPKFMWDMHERNFGRLDKRVVIHDYGLLNIPQILKTTKAVRKVRLYGGDN